MKALILAILSVFFLSQAAEARHLCVFALPDQFFDDMWTQEHPDIMVIGKDWRYLDEFLKKVQDKYNNDSKELLIDIDCHGCASNGLLYLDDTHKASMGSVLSRIEAFFPNRPNMVVVCEACYSGRCYKLTSRGSKDSDLPGEITGPPPFPVYGVFDWSVNVGNLQYLQYINHEHKFQVDLRDYEFERLHPVAVHQWFSLSPLKRALINLLEDLQGLYTI